MMEKKSQRSPLHHVDSFCSNWFSIFVNYRLSLKIRNLIRFCFIFSSSPFFIGILVRNGDDVLYIKERSTCEIIYSRRNLHSKQEEYHTIRIFSNSFFFVNFFRVVFKSSSGNLRINFCGNKA